MAKSMFWTTSLVCLSRPVFQIYIVLQCIQSLHIRSKILLFSLISAYIVLLEYQLVLHRCIYKSSHSFISNWFRLTTDNFILLNQCSEKFVQCHFGQCFSNASAFSNTKWGHSWMCLKFYTPRIILINQKSEKKLYSLWCLF